MVQTEVVFIVLRDADGRLLLQQRSYDDDQYPGCWDASAAGDVEPGEQVEEAVERELKEELGVTPNVTFERIVTYTYPNGTSEVVHVFTGPIEGLESVKCGEEVETARFFTRTETAELLENGDVHPETRYIINTYIL